MENIRDWTQLANIIFSNKGAKSEAFFVHGWSDLSDQMIEFVVSLHHKFHPRMIVLNGLKEYEIGKVGLEYWRKKLSDRGIDKNIIRFIHPDNSLHTFAEARAFMDLAVKEKIGSALIISVPQHIVRAFLTNLGVARQNRIKTNLHPCTIPKIDWHEKINIDSPMGPKEETTRLGRVFGECARIIEYRKRYEDGNKNYLVARVKEGIDYLNSQNKNQ